MVPNECVDYNVTCYVLTRENTLRPSILPTLTVTSSKCDSSVLTPAICYLLNGTSHFKTHGTLLTSLFDIWSFKVLCVLSEERLILNKKSGNSMTGKTLSVFEVLLSGHVGCVCCPRSVRW